ncbi:MAG TPA: hypothetical protein VGS41_02235, partial [Chthonomonadales bacterium]|nr:hypothetical protein [Chthonomonadales bacterium]
ERESIRRYNGGAEYAFRIYADPHTLGIAKAQWEIDPTRGGIRPGAGDPSYVDHVLAARSGFVLNAAAKPKSAKRPSRGNRRRGYVWRRRRRR